MLERDLDLGFPNLQDSENGCDGETENDKESVSINMEIAELKKNGIHTG
jgi:hypothetical protein